MWGISSNMRVSYHSYAPCAAGNLPELVVRSAQKLLMIEKSLDQEVSKAGKTIVLAS
jgi:hypothetical protein